MWWVWPSEAPIDSRNPHVLKFYVYSCLGKHLLPRISGTLDCFSHLLMPLEYRPLSGKQAGGKGSDQLPHHCYHHDGNCSQTQSRCQNPCLSSTVGVHKWACRPCWHCQFCYWVLLGFSVCLIRHSALLKVTRHTWIHNFQGSTCNNKSLFTITISLVLFHLFILII